MWQRSRFGRLQFSFDVACFANPTSKEALDVQGRNRVGNDDMLASSYMYLLK
jgi:hypothetical protein